MTEHIYMDEFFFHTYDSILKKLKKDNGYVERKAEEEQLAQQFSIIDNLREETFKHWGNKARIGSGPKICRIKI